MSTTPRHIKLSLLTAIIILLTAPAVNGEKTLRGKLRPNPEMVTNKGGKVDRQAVFDTVRVTSQTDIRLSGYDKPLNSRKESLFVTNHLSRDITAIELRLNYTDMSDRQLHETTRIIRADIPAGATRRVDFQSWDKQNSFYYHRSRQPRSTNVTPFKVSCTVTAYVWMPTDSIHDRSTVPEP